VGPQRLVAHSPTRGARPGDGQSRIGRPVGWPAGSRPEGAGRRGTAHARPMQWQHRAAGTSGQHPRLREMLMTPEPWRIQIGLSVSISVLHVLQTLQTYLFWRGVQGDSFGSAYVNYSPRGFLGVDR